MTKTITIEFADDLVPKLEADWSPPVQVMIVEGSLLFRTFDDGHPCDSIEKCQKQRTAHGS